MRVSPLFVVCLFVLCIVEEVERRECTTFEMRVGHDWKECFLPSSAVSWWEGNTEVGFGARLSFVSESDWHW